MMNNKKLITKHIVA